MASAPPEVLKPLKTWSHLAERRKRPSEYEIVSTNLHYRQNNPESPWELDPDIHMNEWYRTYCNSSPLKHSNWDEFRDPDSLIYRTYNILQDGQEQYVGGLLDQFSDREHDKSLESEWLRTLARLYTPARYLFHTLQMSSAYLMQIAPASTISNCAVFQAADSLRWLTHTAYRTRELANEYPQMGFGTAERSIWEEDPAWQGLREMMERLLVTWDWGESFVALNLVAKPAIDELMFGALTAAASEAGDTLYSLLSQAQLRDAERHRRWAGALVSFASTEEGNAALIGSWVDKWAPVASSAIDAFATALPDGERSGAAAKVRMQQFHASFDWHA